MSWSERNDQPHPEQLAGQVETLIKLERKAKPSFAPVDDRVQNRFRQPQQRNPGQHSHSQAMGGGMGCEPPAPVKGDIGPRDFLASHAIGLQSEVADEMGQHQQDQQVERRDDFRLNASSSMTVGQVLLPGPRNDSSIGAGPKGRHGGH